MEESTVIANDDLGHTRIPFPNKT